MTDETLSYVKRIAIRNYGLVAVMLLVVLVASILDGQSSELILHRLAIVPLAFLAPGGLSSIYRKPIVEHKVTVRGVEYVVLCALVISLIAFAFVWTPESSFAELVKLFFALFIPLLVLQVIFMFAEISKQKKLRSA